jgi:pilus assembly protein Flp/PilA
MSLIRQFMADDSAATAIEYALIATLISIVIFAGAQAVGVKLQTKFYGPISANLS